MFHHVSYIFDCMDGQMARRFHMMSTVGDYYDHITDVTGEIALLVVIWYKYKSVLTVWEVLLYVVVALSLMHSVACYQKKYRNAKVEEDGRTAEESLDQLNALCIGDVRWTKYMGCGTWTWFTTFLVIWLHMKSEP